MRKRADTFMPRQGFHFCSSVESVCVQQSHQLSADMCLHEQLVTLMQRGSASSGSSVQQLLPYVPKTKKTPLDNNHDSSSVKLHRRQSQHCKAPLWREPLPFLFWRPPDALLLVLKTQPSLLLCHSCMRSCILKGCTSQAHACPIETRLKQQVGGGQKKPKTFHDLKIVWRNFLINHLWLKDTVKSSRVWAADHWLSKR